MPVHAGLETIYIVPKTYLGTGYLSWLMTGNTLAHTEKLCEKILELDGVSTAVNLRGDNYRYFPLKSGDSAGNYKITAEDVFAKITPVPQEGIVIEEVEEIILNDAQLKAAETFTSNIINYVQCSFRGSTTGYAGQPMTFKTELLKGHDASTVHVWYIAEDGTVTEVKFSINEKGEIVINNGLLGLYVITK